MQITRQADYALRAILFLAKLEPNERVSTSRIAEVQHIPSSFLAKIISQLSIAGLISTVRGARGGVSLAKPSNKISMLDVVEAIDGPILLNDCTDPSYGCIFGDDCPIHPIWCQTKLDLVKKLKAATFDQLIK